MNAAVVRRTQEALGKVIRRPPLTEKLLSKPPFRYLHDIITEVIRMTGFMKGLYTDAEMKSDNVKDKDAKISFLQKAIDVVVMVSGEPLSAKPVRIVAGHEPERTNELLQRIGKCCLSKLPSDEAVKRVLAGERSDLKGRTSLTSKSQELDNKNAREEEPGVHKDKEDKRNSEINERSTSRDGKQKEVKEESKAREKDKEKEKTKESDHDRHKDPERDKHREGERERARSRAKQDRDRGNRDRDRDPDRDRERRNEGGKEKEKWKDRERERERDKARDRDRDRRKVKDGEHSREPDREKSREPDKPEKKSSSSGEMSKKLSDGSVKDSKVEAETEISARASRSVTTKASKRRSKNSMEGRRDSRTSENSLSLEHNSSYSKAKKEHAVKQLGTKEANTSAASVSDDNSAGLWRQSLEPEPAVKQKGAWSGNVIPGPLLSTTHASSGPVSTGLWEAPVFHTRDSPSDAEGEVGLPGPEKSEVSESSELPSELPANIRRIPRPGSARPAPPRVKRQDSVEALTPDRTGSGKIVASVIVDTQNSDNEEDDQFVVEAAPPLPEMSELEMVPAVDVEDEEKHGGLVKKILETKKDYEKLQRSPRPGEKGSHRDELGVSHTLNAAASAREKLLVFESAWKKEKDIVSKEIEKLRVSIQTLCKSALPLGKIMDYIQEDVDAMQNELQLWHNENKQHAEALQKEQSITDCAVEPLKAELAELEQLIKDQQDKICAVKANVLKNEEKIQRMVYSINLSSRR
ncbi:TRAF3-interacting protein 1 isoform X4 [Canis lupus dingo]|uniref:TRAF3-interacting protein 1 isoform X4 n=1 Tax=Canis lupus dingo TaxID=286419 RepID=UPI0020C4AFC3|nr:TRAF3-interacting protein 1 isoform X4 [Canis lupus dingo]